MTLVINGIDYSPCIKDNGYFVGYEKREGPNGGMSLNGTIITDVIARKAVVSCELIAMTAEMLSTLLQALWNDCVTVTYFDTHLNGSRTAMFIPAISDQNFAFRRHGVNFFRDGIKLTLREQ